MPAPVVVLTPNLCGRDGISRLARLVTGAFDEVTVLALHEPASVTRVRARRRARRGRTRARGSSPPRCAARRAADRRTA